MESNLGTLTVWQSGRLAPQARPRRLEFTRDQWIATALLLLSALVMALYVGVLERDVQRSAMAHLAQRSRAVAEAQCEADQPAERRGRCIALFNGDVVAADAAEARNPQDDGARTVAVSLLAPPR